MTIPDHISAKDPMTTTKTRRLRQPMQDRPYGILMVILGVIGLIMSTVLLMEKFIMAEDPTHIPSCTFNSVLACGSILNSAQAAVFYIPNPVLGIFGFACVIVVGMAVLAGARFAAWFWACFLAGTTLAMIFIHWLAFESLWSINALCPWCMVVWAVTIPIFWFSLLHIIAPEDPAEAHSGAEKFWVFCVKYRELILVVWYLLFFIFIWARFGNALFGL
ncbi:vitamin K epoxide reductase family protein [Corynebacterium occultum]|nr:vitamin K epoxide reductase family protein [Corynebacterium occultum]